MRDWFLSATFHNPTHREEPEDGSQRIGVFSPRTVGDLKRQLDSVWQQSRPIILERFARLDAFVLAVEAGSFTTQQYEDAITIAHTFAGSLGMFGYPEGTELARSMEQWLEVTPSPNPATLREYAAGLHSILSL